MERYSPLVEHALKRMRDKIETRSDLEDLKLLLSELGAAAEAADRAGFSGSLAASFDALREQRDQVAKNKALLVAALQGCLGYVDYVANNGNADADRHAANVRNILRKLGEEA